jgi:hypothetical protein
MIVRKNRYVRIKVIGGSGIFDTIINIAKKPIMQKLLTSAGKSMASALGEKLVASVMPPAVPPCGNTAQAPQQMESVCNQLQVSLLI